MKMAVYATYLTNYYGFILRNIKDSSLKKKLRVEYAQKLLGKLSIDVKVLNPEKVPLDGQYLLVSNHRSVIDPLIVELALEKTSIYGLWVAKKELYNSFFFGLFVRKAGTILLDRTNKKLGSFMSNVKTCVKQGDSIFIFPEGTRNKSEKELTEFKEGSRLIALKNRLDILPIYIKNNANNALMNSLHGGEDTKVVEVVIGDVISYKDKSMSLEELYKKQFEILN